MFSSLSFFGRIAKRRSTPRKQKRHDQNTHATRRRLLLEQLEDRRPLATFVESAASTTILNVVLGADEHLAVQSTPSDTYTFTLAGGTWSGTDSTNVTGHGSNLLTVTSAGRATFDMIDITDSAATAGVAFADSGDNICEQHIHNLDVCNWAWAKDGDPKKAHPVEANGMGGCLQRYLGGNKGTGQIFDEHFVEFTFADGIKMFSQCRHIPNTFSSVSEHAHGVKGESNCSGWIRGETEWRYDGPRVNSMVEEHKALIAAVRAGTPYNEGWHGASSSMTAVLGRMATYSGKIVKWDDAVAKGTSEFPESLAWDAPAPVNKNDSGDYPIPMPGIYQPY